MAFEIGSGLLTEVRRLQSIVGERDKVIQDMKEEWDSSEKTIESLRSGLQAQEQNAGELLVFIYPECIPNLPVDKLKEDNWNLEVTLEELRSQLSDSQATIQRLESEQKRFVNLLAAACEGADQIGIESEKPTVSFDEFKAKITQILMSFPTT